MSLLHYHIKELALSSADIATVGTYIERFSADLWVNQAHSNYSPCRPMTTAQPYYMYCMKIIHVVGDPGVKIDTKSLKAEFHIWLSASVIFSYSGFKTGIARGILSNLASSKQGGQLYWKWPTVTYFGFVVKVLNFLTQFFVDTFLTPLDIKNN